MDAMKRLACLVSSLIVGTSAVYILSEFRVIGFEFDAWQVLAVSAALWFLTLAFERGEVKDK